MTSLPENITSKEDAYRILQHDYRTILATTQDGFFVCNMQGKIIAVNDVYCTMVGYTESELLTMRIPDLEVIESPEETAKHIQKIVSTGSDLFETVHRKKNGGTISLQISVTFVPSEGGKFISFIRDITEKQALLAHLEERKYNLDKAQELAHIGHWELDLISNDLYWSDEVYRIFGLAPQEMLPSYDLFLEHIHPDDRQKVNEAYSESVLHKQDYRITHRIVTKNGDIRHVEERCTHRYDADGNVVHSIGTVHDITERVRFENELQVASSVFTYSNEAIVITNKENNIVAINHAFERLSGYTKEEAIGKNPRIFSSGWGDRHFYEKMWNDLDTNGIWRGEIVDRRKNGETYSAEVSILVVKDDQKNVINYIAISRDITESKEQNEKIRRYAYYDGLTGLPNRRLFQQEVESHILTSHYYEQQFALFFLDLDNFKWINDSLGHHIGDKVLIQVSRMIQPLLPEGSLFSRLGGDEFVIFKPYKNIHKVTQLASKIIDTVKYPISIDGVDLSVGWSIGISLYPSNGTNYDELLKNADAAMYEAKANGKNTFRFFNDEMNLSANKRLELDTRLRHAAEYNEFFLVYQPKVSCTTRRISGFEVLIRWHDTKLGFVPPDQFIPVAEQSGYIYDIGMWVIKQALKDFKSIQSLAGESTHIAINVSAKQLEDPRFYNDIAAALRESGVTAQTLEFEITETAIMEKIDRIVPLLEQIRGLGIKLSIDDFGTGYSSLSYLKKLPADVLKIDRTFIADIVRDEEDRAIVTATIALAKALKMQTVAEGVEEEAHIPLLTQMGCDMYQGYYFSKPLALEPLMEFLEKTGI